MDVNPHTVTITEAGQLQPEKIQRLDALIMTLPFSNAVEIIDQCIAKVFLIEDTMAGLNAVPGNEQEVFQLGHQVAVMHKHITTLRTELEQKVSVTPEITQHTRDLVTALFLLGPKYWKTHS